MEPVLTKSIEKVFDKRLQKKAMELYGTDQKQIEFMSEKKFNVDNRDGLKSTVTSCVTQ